jgi:hypothetical protein
LPEFRSDFCPTAPALHPHCTHKVENAKGNGCTCTRCTRGSGIPDTARRDCTEEQEKYRIEKWKVKGKLKAQKREVAE